jgi:hypothetical protein
MIDSRRQDWSNDKDPTRNDQVEMLRRRRGRRGMRPFQLLARTGAFEECQVIRHAGEGDFPEQFRNSVYADLAGASFSHTSTPVDK